jgi:hypothetical protein
MPSIGALAEEKFRVLEKAEENPALKQKKGPVFKLRGEKPHVF